MRHISFRLLVLYIILGAVIGSLIGEIAQLLPESVVKEFFLRSIPIDIGPATFQLKVLSLTLGFSLILNVSGVLGVVIAVYILRWYR